MLKDIEIEQEGKGTDTEIEESYLVQKSFALAACESGGGKDKAEKWLRAYNKFNYFASLNLHLEDLKKSSKYSSTDVAVSKSDAEHLLMNLSQNTVRH